MFLALVKCDCQLVVRQCYLSYSYLAFVGRIVCNTLSLKEYFINRGSRPWYRAALGMIPFGMTTEARGAFAGLGQERAGNARLDQVPGSMAWS